MTSSTITNEPAAFPAAGSFLYGKADLSPWLPHALPGYSIMREIPFGVKKEYTHSQSSAIVVKILSGKRRMLQKKERFRKWIPEQRHF